MVSIRIGLLGFLAAVQILISFVDVYASNAIVSIEPAGRTESSAWFEYVGVERFDDLVQYREYDEYVSNFGLGPASQIKGKYSLLYVRPADAFGGAGGRGLYAAAYAGFSCSLRLNATVPINYFGLFGTAIERGDVLTFYHNGEEVFKFTALDLPPLFEMPGDNTRTSRGLEYFGNPSWPDSDGSKSNSGQAYVFLNFFFIEGTFDEVKFENLTTGGLESDNHTVGYFTKTNGYFKERNQKIH